MNILKAIENILEDKDRVFVHSKYKLHWHEKIGAVYVEDTQTNMQWNALEVRFLDIDWQEIGEPLSFTEALSTERKIKWDSSSYDNNNEFDEFMNPVNFMEELIEEYYEDEIIKILSSREFYVEDK